MGTVGCFFLGFILKKSFVNRYKQIIYKLLALIAFIDYILDNYCDILKKMKLNN